MTREEYLQHADECEWLAEMWRKMAADIKSRERGACWAISEGDRHFKQTLCQPEWR
jgi:hypothetical protein